MERETGTVKAMVQAHSQICNEDMTLVSGR